MPLAVISDIHGNLVALDAVLSDLATRSIEPTLCLGDVAATGPQPREVIARLRELGCPVVMGNTDDWLLHPAVKTNTEDDDMDRRRLQEIELWGAEQLTAEDRAYLASFQPTVSMELEGGMRLLAYHGSPRSFDEQILPTLSSDGLDAALDGREADLYIGGHTHMQMFCRHRRSLVINPGSVGLAIDSGPPFDGPICNPAWAEYAIINAGGPDELTVELRRAPFDVEALRQAIYASGMPHADWLAREWGA
jgi:predicted phosphodiesterase